MAGNELIRISHLRKEYSNDSIPLEDVNAVINRGETICIIGPSGTGKSTLLRLINGLEKATSGSIIFDNMELTAPHTNWPVIRQKMGMVFQSFNLFSHMNVAENIMYALTKLKKYSKQKAYDKTMELLRMVGLQNKALAWPEELSGGQQQRVAIARTLALEPEIILFDEPTSALDPTMIGEVLSVIRMLSKSGITMLIVTHEMNFAKEISDRVFFMNNGKIVEEGTPEQIFSNPQNAETRNYIEQAKLLLCSFNDTDFDFGAIHAHMDDFGRKHQLMPRIISHLQLVFEEISIVTFLNPNMHLAFNGELMVRYFTLDNSINMKLQWSGNNANPLELMDTISQKVIKGCTTSYEYSYNANDKLPNTVTANFAGFKPST